MTLGRAGAQSKAPDDLFAAAQTYPGFEKRLEVRGGGKGDEKETPQGLDTVALPTCPEEGKLLKYFCNVNSRVPHKSAYGGGERNVKDQPKD